MDEQNQKKYEHAMTLMEYSRYKQAISILMNLHLLEPNDFDICTALTRCFIDSYERAEALEFARKLVAMDPDNGYTYYLLSFALRQNQQLDRSLEAAKKSLSLDPDYVPAYATLALIHSNKGNYDASLKYANSGLALDPQDYFCLSHKLLALCTLKRFDEMDQTLRIATEVYPDAAYIHYMRGWYHFKQIHPYRALRHFKTALRIDPISSGYEKDLKLALRDANPLRYFGLQVPLIFERYTIRIIVSLVVLFVIDILLMPFHFSIWFSALAVFIGLLIFGLSRISLLIADFYTNLYLWSNPRTRHFLTESDKKNGIKTIIITVIILIMVIYVHSWKALILLAEAGFFMNWIYVKSKKN